MSRPKIVIKSKNNNDQKSPPEKDSKKEEIIDQSTKEVIEEPENSPVEEEISSSIESKTQETAEEGFPWGLIIGIFGILIVLGGVLYYFFFYTSSNTEGENPVISDNVELVEEISAENKDDNSYEAKYSDYEKDILSERISLSDILINAGVPSADISELKDQAVKKNLSYFEKGDKYSVYYEEDIPHIIIIEPKFNPYIKYEFDLSNLSLKQIKKDKEIRLIQLAGIVESNLGITFINNNFNLKLINKLEEIFKYSVDFFQIDDGDRFKILYEQEFLDGKPFQIVKIRAALIQEGNRDYYAFLNNSKGKLEYYDDYGESLKRSFLSSPIKYGGVISSGFGLRVHPIEGHSKMHLGTDYAAPEGTPIVATADGKISIQSSTTNNGNYIKIRHDNTFETQYLHMQKFNTAFRQGSRVRQGDVIGYVGQTGMANGPHVCYRFWKDKQQVDPKKEIGNVQSKIPSQNLSKYLDYTKSMKSTLKKIEYF